MKEYFLAEKLKYRHTSMNCLTVAMPFSGVFLAAWLLNIFFAVDSYNWWYIGLYPGFIGIMCSIIGGKDKKKKNFTILSLPCRMAGIWDAKIMVGAMMSGIAVGIVVISTIIMGKVLEITMNVQFVASPSVAMQILAGIVMWLTTLWQIPFCLFLTQKVGKFLMLVIHLGIYLVLTVTVSLSSWFPLFPGAITSRLMCPILGVLPNGLLLQPGQTTYSPELAEMSSLIIGIPAAIIWFVLFWWGSRRWFERKVVSK